MLEVYYMYYCGNDLFHLAEDLIHCFHVCNNLQVQYVFTEKVLDPQLVCEQVHLCDEVPVLSDAPSHSHRRRSPSSTVTSDINGRTSTPQLSSAQPKPGSQQITFVQISDIHLDHLYAEVMIM